MANQILTPEEKLKNLRKRFGLKQHEITDGQITRNLVSMIENGKARLTYDNGVKIVDKINKVLASRSIDIVVSPEEILETVEDQIESISVDYLEDFNKNPSEKLANEINYFLANKKYTHTKFQLYKNIGNFYYTNSDFSLATIYYSKIYDLSVKYETGVSLYELIANYTDSLMKLMQFNEIIHIIKLSDQFSANITKEQKTELFIIKLRALIMLKKFTLAQKVMVKNSELKSSVKTPFKKAYLLWLDAFLNVKTNKISEAKKLLKRAVNHKNSANRLVGLTGLAFIYRLESDKANLKITVDNIENDLNSVNDRDFINFLNGYLGKFHLKLENYRCAEEYFKKTLEFKDNIYDLNAKYSAISNLLDLYSISEQFNKVDELENIALEWLEMSYLKNNDPIFIKLVYIYSKSNSMFRIKELLRKIEINDEIL